MKGEHTIEYHKKAINYRVMNAYTHSLLPITNPKNKTITIVNKISEKGIRLEGDNASLSYSNGPRKKKEPAKAVIGARVYKIVRIVKLWVNQPVTVISSANMQHIVNNPVLYFKGKWAQQGLDSALSCSSS